jgi:hypothetical protein
MGWRFHGSEADHPVVEYEALLPMYAADLGKETALTLSKLRTPTPR